MFVGKSSGEHRTHGGAIQRGDIMCLEVMGHNGSFWGTCDTEKGRPIHYFSWLTVVGDISPSQWRKHGDCQSLVPDRGNLWLLTAQSHMQVESLVRTRVAITSVNQLPTVSIVPNILEIATLAGFKHMSRWRTF